MGGDRAGLESQSLPPETGDGGVQAVDDVGLGVDAGHRHRMASYLGQEVIGRERQYARSAAEVDGVDRRAPDRVVERVREDLD